MSVTQFKPLDIKKVVEEIRKGTKFYVDLETCGLHSMAVLMQFAIDSGPIYLFDIWREPVWKTLHLIEESLDLVQVAFNNCFDHFHLSKLHTIWSLLPPDWIPQDHIHEIAMREPDGRDGLCLKPYKALDLMLVSRNGPFQSLMARKDIRIKKVPNALAGQLRGWLEECVEIDGIYFACSKTPGAPRWTLSDIKNKRDEINPDFKDIVLRFKASGGLKALAEYALGLTPKYHYEDIEPPKSWRPFEFGYSPTALSVSKPENDWLADRFVGTPPKKKNLDWPHRPKEYTWPYLIHKHIEFWATNKNAREYALDDVTYTRALDEYFGFPEPGDDDSELACEVASVRWHGFAINIPGTEKLCAEVEAKLEKSPINFNRTVEVSEYIQGAMDEAEAMACDLDKSVAAAVLEGIAKEMEFGDDEAGDECTKCEGSGCPRCLGTGAIDPTALPSDYETKNHPAAHRCTEILKLKSAAKQRDRYRKLLTAGRFHADFKIVGAMSSRMSGSSGLSAHGIPNINEVRALFYLKHDGYMLSGGDFDSFEVTIADTVYGDPKLHEDLKASKKIHALFGQALYPHCSYEEIMASKGVKEGVNMYGQGKSGIFAMTFGGDWKTLVRKQGIPEEIAKPAEQRFFDRYDQIPVARQKIEDKFAAILQPGGRGTEVIWNDPDEYIETFLGYRRYFTLENKIIKLLYELANNPPSEWRDIRGTVNRRDREQTVAGATQSAIFLAAFNVQGANIRAAGNHVIQSPGAQITKRVQRRIWDLQPAGVHEFNVLPMNCHDEVLVVHKPELKDIVKQIVHDTTEEYRKHVPLIKIDWYSDIDNWSEKG